MIYIVVIVVILLMLIIAGIVVRAKGSSNRRQLNQGRHAATFNVPPAFINHTFNEQPVTHQYDDSVEPSNDMQQSANVNSEYMVIANSNDDEMGYGFPAEDIDEMFV